MTLVRLVGCLGAGNGFADCAVEDLRSEDGEYPTLQVEMRQQLPLYAFGALVPPLAKKPFKYEAGWWGGREREVERERGRENTHTHTDTQTHRHTHTHTDTHTHTHTDTQEAVLTNQHHHRLPTIQAADPRTQCCAILWRSRGAVIGCAVMSTLGIISVPLPPYSSTSKRQLEYKAARQPSPSLFTFTHTPISHKTGAV